MKNLDGFVTMKDGTEISINIVKEDLSDDCVENFEKFVSSDDITLIFMVYDFCRLIMQQLFDF